MIKSMFDIFKLKIIVKGTPWEENCQFCQFWILKLYEAIKFYASFNKYKNITKTMLKH